MDKKLNIPLPSKGLVVDRPGEYVDSRSASAIKNMEFNRSIIRKRRGTIAVGSSLGERVMRYFELQVGPATRLFRVGITKVEVLDKSTGIWSSVANAPLNGAAAGTVDFAFPLLSAEKVAVYTNGIDPIRKCSITGNDADLGGTPPHCRFVQAFGPYLVLAYVIDSGDTFYTRVQWCDTGNIETWVGGNAGSVNLLDDPEDITGIGVFGGQITIHKSKSIYVGQLVTTSDVFRFDRKATGVGAVAAATIIELPSGEQIFLASDGLHLFNGITAPLINSPVQDELRETMNPAVLYKAQAVFVQEEDEYWVAIPIGSQTEPETVYKYNYRTQQMYKDDRPDLTAMGVFLNTSDLTWDEVPSDWDSSADLWDSNALSSLNPVVILGDSSGASTKRSGTTNDDAGDAVESYVETKDFTAEDVGDADIDRMVRWKGMEVWAKGSAVSVYYSTNGGVSWTLAGVLILASDYPDDDSPLNVWFDVVKREGLSR